MSDLSLRTIQRIEAKAVASQESVKCLAAVFEIDAKFLFDENEVTTSQNEGFVQAENTVGKQISTTEKDMRKKWFAYFAAMFISYMFGFYGIFNAFDEGRITYDTFQLMKNSVSIALIVTSLVMSFQYKRMKRKCEAGSS